MNHNEQTTIWIVEYGSKRWFYTVKENAERKFNGIIEWNDKLNFAGFPPLPYQIPKMFELTAKPVKLK